MLIATWNVNSIRTRLTQIEAFIDEVSPDVLCLQETKVQDNLFPYESLEKKGYNINFHGQKSYNGVAIISNKDQEETIYGLDGLLVDSQKASDLSSQKRIISSIINGIRFINVYVPNGSSLDSDKYQYKIEWLKCLKSYVQKLKQEEAPICLMGDFNIALEDKDIHNPQRLSGQIMASPKERLALQEIIGEDLEDIFRVFEQDTGHWSWWDYRSNAWLRDKGWRIDHIYLQNELVSASNSCYIYKKSRGNTQPSDHAPVLVDLQWPIDEVFEDFYSY